jgi:drug/metabolite transporter (DMT)-like permease
MSLLGFSLVFIAACCHAIWNFCVKKLNSGPELIWLFSLCSVIIYLPVAVVISCSNSLAIDPRTSLFVVGSVILHLGYFLLLQLGYRKGDLSVVYPIARATGPMLSTSLAVLLLKENITLQTVIGGLIVIFAISQLSSKSTNRTSNLLMSLMFGLGAGALIGSYTVWDAYTVSVLLFPPLLLDYVSSIGRCVLLAPVALKRKARLKALWDESKFLILVISVFNPLAYIFVLYALTFTPVVYVAPIREISVLFSVLLGTFFLKEGDMYRRLIWGIIIVVGISLLSLG